MQKQYSKLYTQVQKELKDALDEQKKSEKISLAKLMQRILQDYFNRESGCEKTKSK